MVSSGDIFYRPSVCLLSMASNKSRNTSPPHAYRPKLPTGSYLKRSAFDKSSIRRNLKHPTIESSQMGDDIDDQDAIFRPWQSLSNQPDNIDEESEDDCELKEDGSNATGKKNFTWYGETDLVLVDALLEQMEMGEKISITCTSASTSVTNQIQMLKLFTTNMWQISTSMAFPLGKREQSKAMELAKRKASSVDKRSGKL
ncbi:hypothetical protein Cgig2_027949 [Carnegiea gigantea]|uniref:Uncharacterized protein n=1 Tax=Carnegiea gigantea TaxID=171969 RepID=A0A9Q1JL10_9CARY|nr:hypothetical protein Cgig2_027949 [Carnegiea gigantea]